MLSILRTSAAVLALSVFTGCSLLRPSSTEAPSPEPLAGVEVLSRAEWGAEPPLYAMTPQTPDALTIHHTGTPQHPERTAAAKMKALQVFSVSSDTLDDGSPKKPWPDVPYHFYIATDGTIVEGRDVRFAGDTNTSYDLTGQIQIVVEGNFMEETPTEAQMTSLKQLAAALAARYHITTDHVGGHRDRAGRDQTDCPGDALEARFPEVLAAMRAAYRPDRVSQP